MKIHQITDLHIPDDEYDVGFEHVRVNILRQLSFVASEQPDLLVITGDLSMKDHSRQACTWLKDHLPDTRTLVIPGNHDDPEMVSDIFGPCASTQEFDDCTLIFADTSSCVLPNRQREFLEQVKSDKPCLLFVHHPPALIGTGFMARTQPLGNHQEMAQAIGQSDIDYVFCGHFHNQAEMACEGFELYLTPSPAFQVSLTEPEFTREVFEPGVRVIEVQGKQASTRVISV